MGTLLPVVGRGRPPPVDGRPGRAHARRRPPTPAQTTGRARRRLVDRPHRRSDPGIARRAGRRTGARGVLGPAVRPRPGPTERTDGRHRRVPSDRATDARGGGQVPVPRRGPPGGRLHRRVRQGRGMDVHQPEGRIDPGVHARRVDGPGRPVARADPARGSRAGPRRRAADPERRTPHALRVPDHRQERPRHLDPRGGRGARRRRRSSPLSPGRDVRRHRAEERRGPTREGAGHREGGRHQAARPARDAELLPPGGLARPADAPHQHPGVRPDPRGKPGQRSDLP